MYILDEWYKRAERGTSGDMVYDILADWKLSIIKYKEKIICPNCGTELLKFARAEIGTGGVSFLWLCGSVNPTIVSVSSAMPHQDWFISCKGLDTKIDGMTFDNLSDIEMKIRNI